MAPGRLAALALLPATTLLQTSVGVHLQVDPTRASALSSEARARRHRRDGRHRRRVKGRVSEKVRAWFDVVESFVPSVDYSRIPSCSAENIAYINVVVHIRNGSWSVVCGSLTGNRGPPLKDILDKVAPQLPNVDVHLPFGLHDGVQRGGRPGREEQHVPVFGAAYHKRYSESTLPFAMGNYRTAKKGYGYVNTPVIGWNEYVKTWFSCNTTAPTIKKAVFRGKAAGSGVQKYGTCTNACSWRDNGRLFVHSLGRQHPHLLDVAATNANEFNVPELKGEPPQPIPFPEQLCKYQAVLNVGNNLDWAERLRCSFYGNAVILHPEDAGHEFFNSFMEPYVHYWPLKADLSDVVEQVQHVLELPNVTEQVQGQRAFADKFLTERFMLHWNRVAILEYDRRVRMFKAGTWAAPNAVIHQNAKDLLKLNGCEERDYRKRECPAVEQGPARA